MTDALRFDADVYRNARRLAMIRPGAPWLLDAYCGAGGAGMGYWLAGFNVLGVDIAPQPNYPFLFVQGDAVAFIRQYGAAFDAIHASPPCQVFSVTYALPNVGEYPNLIAGTRAVLVSTGKPFIIENVKRAPLCNPIKLSGPQFGLRVIRERAFECSPWLLAPPPVKATGKTASHRGYSSFARGAKYITVAGNNYDAEDGRRAMGIFWMSSRAELSESIPPAYTEYIGRQLMRAVLNARQEVRAA